MHLRYNSRPMKLQFQSVVCLLLMFAPIAMPQDVSRHNSNKHIVGESDVYAHPSQVSHVNDMHPERLNSSGTANDGDGFGVTINDGFYNPMLATNAMGIQDGFVSSNQLKSQSMKTANSVTDIIGAKSNEGVKQLTTETSKMKVKHRSVKMLNSDTIPNNSADTSATAFNAWHNDPSNKTIGDISNDELSSINQMDSQSSNITSTAISDTLAKKSGILNPVLLNSQPIKRVSGSIRHVLKGTVVNGFASLLSNVDDASVNSNAVVDSAMDIASSGNGNVHNSKEASIPMDTGNKEYGASITVSKSPGIEEITHKTAPIVSTGGLNKPNKTTVKIKIRQPQTVSELIRLVGLNSKYISNQFGIAANEHRVGNDTENKISKKQNGKLIKGTHNIELSVPNLSGRAVLDELESQNSEVIVSKSQKVVHGVNDKHISNIVPDGVPREKGLVKNIIQVIERKPKNIHYSVINRTDDFATSSISNKQNSKNTKSIQAEVTKPTNVHYPMVDATDGFFNSNKSSTQRSIKSTHIRVVDKLSNAVPSSAVDPTDGFVSPSNTHDRVADTRHVEVGKNEAKHTSNSPSNVQANKIVLNLNRINKQLLTNTQATQARLSPNTRVLIPAGMRRGVSNVLPEVISFGNRPRYTIGTTANGVLFNSSGSRPMPIQEYSGRQSGQEFRRRIFRPDSSQFSTRGRSARRFLTEISLTDVPGSETHMRRGMPLGTLPSTVLPITGGRRRMFRFHRTDMPGRDVGVGTGSSRRFDMPGRDEGVGTGSSRRFDMPGRDESVGTGSSRRFDRSDSIFTSGMRMPSSRMRSVIDSRRTTDTMPQSDAFRFPRRITSVRSVPTRTMIHTRSGQTNMPRGQTDVGMSRRGEFSTSNMGRDSRFRGGVDSFSRGISRDRFDREIPRVSESLPGGGFGSGMVRSGAFRGGIPRRGIFGDGTARGSDLGGAMVRGSGFSPGIPRGSIFGSRAIRDDIPIGIGFGTSRLSGAGFRRFPA